MDAAQRLPVEMLIKIIEAATEDPIAAQWDSQQYASAKAATTSRAVGTTSNTASLANLAMVCWAWHRRSAALLFSRIIVRLPFIDELLEHLRLPHNNISQHARSLTVLGGPSTVEFTKWYQVLSCLPHVVSWRCVRSVVHDADKTSCYDHHQTRTVSLLPGGSTPFDNVKYFILAKWSFDSPAHLLGLLACLPRLQSVDLNSVLFSRSWAETSRRHQRFRRTELSKINATDCDNIAPLVYSWVCRRNPSAQGSYRRNYCDLIAQEANAVVKILATAGSDRFINQELCVDVSTNSEGSIFWLQRRQLYAEFHTRGIPQVSQPSTPIVHVLLRFRLRAGQTEANLCIPICREDLKICKALAELPFLTTIILEAKYPEDLSNITPHFSGFGDKVRVRSCQESARLTRDASSVDEPGRGDDSADVVSIYWCNHSLEDWDDDWFHMFFDYPLEYSLPGIVVPQKVFVPPAAQVIPAGQRLSPVRFAVNGVPGVNLAQAIAGNLAGLTQVNEDHNVVGNADATPFLTANTTYRISLRILWPGYPPWSVQMHTADNQLRPFSIARLATQTATMIERFLQEHNQIQSTELNDHWKITTNLLDQLYLVELRQVTGRNWQPVLCLSPR